MKALSIKQPWAELILLGVKPYEYRTWETLYRGELVIHASKVDDDTPLATLRACDGFKQAGIEFGTEEERKLARGAIVGVVSLADCELFAPGEFRWKVEKPRRLKEPIPFKGRLGLWDIPGGIAKKIEEGLVK